MLPEGFTVRLGRRTEVREGGTVLVGGAPTRVLKLSASAQMRLDGGDLTVRDGTSRTLAELLLDAGLAAPVASTLEPIDLNQLTVVVPVYDRPRMLDRLLGSLPSGLGAVIVVDDASPTGPAIAAATARHRAQLVRLEQNGGSAAARNVGLARARTPFVAFVDSDVVMNPGCFETLLRHFADPRLAIAAPRVLGLAREQRNWISRYENARSSLDLGDEPAGVRPRSPVSWVSSTCLVTRRDMVGEGFDPTMRVGEDVDFVWRSVARGYRVRFEPAATVRHEHRTRGGAWLRRKFFYGTGAAPLAARHPDDVAPAVLAPWAALTLVAIVAQRRWSLPVAALLGGLAMWRITRRLSHLHSPRRVALSLITKGHLAMAAQGVALIVRHWWPAAAVAAVFSRRMRRAVVVASLVDVCWEYARLRPDLDPARFALARRMDDLAYGAGVWWSAIHARSLRPLAPAISRGTSSMRRIERSEPSSKGE